MKKPPFAVRLQAILDERKVSVQDLAKKAGLSRQSVHRFLTGERLPAHEAFLAIAEALNVSLDEFRPKRKKR